MTLLSRGASWLADRMQTAAGRTITYRRGTSTSASIVGWVDRHEYQEMGDDGLQVTVVMDDWTFLASELVISATTITPRAGDQITEGSTIYEVLPTANRQCYERFDHSTNGTLLKVHTKRVGG